MMMGIFAKASCRKAYNGNKTCDQKKRKRSPS